MPPAEADHFLDWAQESLSHGRRRRSTRELVAAVHRSKGTRGEKVSDATCTVEDLYPLIEQGRQFGAIMPPWRHPKPITYGSACNEYETMTVEEIAALPIRELAKPDGHLHIWIVPTVWWDVREIVEAWGFIPDPPRPFVWCKEGRIGMGNIWRGRHEMMLSFVRGNAKYANDKSVPSTLLTPRLGHSEKPDEVRERIERVSPPPFLELFGRKPVDGWAVWGNQIARTALQTTFEHPPLGAEAD